MESQGMIATEQHARPNASATAGVRARAVVALLAACLLNGCAAVTNPVFDSVPVRLLPPELLGPTKAPAHTIPLNVLRQPAPAVYKLDVGDVLGIYIDTITGERNQQAPLHIAPMLVGRDQYRLAPASGYPFPVQEDGTVALPLLGKLPVKGLTLDESRETLRAAYLKKELIRPDNDRISVTLLHPRQYQVMVLRQEASAFAFGPEGPLPTAKRNTGHLVDLPAYQNDILHALTKTGGLPEFDVYNEIIIYRDRLRDDQDKARLLKQLEKQPLGKELALPPSNADELGKLVGETIRIPLRLPHGTPLPFSYEDILLRNGDVIFLEARDEQVFFTGGLLPPGKYVLPRDQDLDVVQAITQVHGPFFNGAFGGNNLSGALVAPGLGSPSPSLLVVVRRVPGYGQVRILVDLRRALRDPTERILVQPGDLLIMQEKPGEALARYMSQSFLNVEIFWRFLSSPTATGAVNIAGPDRVGSRLGTVTTTQP